MPDEAGVSWGDVELDAELADTPWGRFRGLMLREPRPLVLDYDAEAARDVHTYFCLGPLDVAWLVDGRVEHKTSVPAWRATEGYAADAILEAPRAELSGLVEGDYVSVDRR